jgi:hypothetical protein
VRLELGLADGLGALRQTSGDLEHLTGTLAIGSSDQRSVDVEETARVEESMRGISEVVLNATDSTESVSAVSQVSVLSQSLIKHGVSK